MILRLLTAILLTWFCSLAAVAQEAGAEKLLTPVEARAKDGEKVYVELTVQSAKNALADRGAVYLDSEKNFRDEKNIAISINKAGAADMKKAGIEDPAEHFRGKTIRVRGTLTIKDKVARIEVREAKQIELVAAKP